ncbi:MAG TPA: glycosyltransferase [Bacteroidales bacterium]|nr:glycosyltransferase [Bacteroidales bacterium]
MRIIYFVQDLSKGGAERLVLDICNELNKRTGVEYLVVGFTNKNDYKELSINVPYIHCNSTIKLSIFKRNEIQIDSLIKIITEFKPNIIHSNLYICELLTREKIFNNIKYFSHCHSNMPEFKKFGIQTLFKKQLFSNFYEKNRIENKYLQCNNQFIVISKDTYKYYFKNLTYSLKKNIHFLPNAIDYNRFNVLPKITETLNFINVGSFVTKKNQIYFIPVAKELIKKGLEFKIILLGDGLLKSEFIAEMRKNQLEKYFELPGNVNNVEDYYAKSKIYIHAALYEPFGLVLLEAMAAGLPVICLDGKGNRDIIEDGKNGFILYNQNVANFSGKIIQLIENKELYQAMSSYAKEYAKKYDIKDYVDKLLEMYKKSME